jgi:hypothetical protein
MEKDGTISQDTHAFHHHHYRNRVVVVFYVPLDTTKFGNPGSDIYIVYLYFYVSVGTLSLSL